MNPIKGPCHGTAHAIVSWLRKKAHERLEELIKVAQACALLSLSGLVLLSAVSLRISFWGHATGALLFFGGSMLGVLITTGLCECIVQFDAHATRRDRRLLRIRIGCASFCLLLMPSNGPLLVALVRGWSSDLLSNGPLFDSVACCEYGFVVVLTAWVCSFSSDLAADRIVVTADRGPHRGCHLYNQ